MGRQPCCEKIGLKRGPWTMDEDSKLVEFILNNGIQCWRLVPKLAGLMRCGKSCRLRWINYLRPDLKRGAFTEAEEDMIIQLHSRLGNRWSKIARHLPGRTDNEIKNHWNTRIKKKLKDLGLDPHTHKPIIHHHQTSTPQKEELVLAHHQNIDPFLETDKDCLQMQQQNLAEEQESPLFSPPNLLQVDADENHDAYETSSSLVSSGVRMEEQDSPLLVGMPSLESFSMDPYWMADPFLSDGFITPFGHYYYYCFP